MDCLTKNQLIDLVADLAYAEVGEDASDTAILEWAEGKLAPIFAYRNDRRISLLGKYESRKRSAEEYAKRLTNNNNG